ncbi:phosphate/phosphite/phosphonate ABC transporter substrate-binding protein [Alkalicoccobacillus porphyridii]|uniref:Phosphate/phosphite/phosphonate ABC transporter substrate-binding protein n=1 Tax=Alkalicoccobacillus porphyridii TaxID=2597270 RepID=A0A553ZZX7_9BACI|nr:phosphate/phosphite/phosphonate ABC transporter substrate-binding protein [Alkalicoccobacillus porphyridii]TSB47004.1 phosphate/phosphite/phosphonate ABC transporter substrate-binding protein [Alkalicoccobacillus porphyridii]
MKKHWYGTGLTFALTAALLAGCGSGDSDADAGGNGGTSGEGDSEETTGYVPEELRVQFVPSQNADTLEAKAKPLEELLTAELDIPVTVSVSTDYNTIVEAMASEQVDVGFLPPTAYVLAAEQGAAEVILQAQRYGVNDDGSPTDELVDFYLSQIVVKKDSGIESIEDLEGKKIGYQSVTSSAGYVWPAAVLIDAGLDPLTDVEPVTLKGHDQAIIALLNGDVDAAASFQDARNVVESDYPEVFEDTEILAYTEAIPNDTIAVLPGMDQEWKDKIQAAFIAIGESDEGREIIKDVYTHEGYVESDDSKFETVREYNEKVKTE